MLKKIKEKLPTYLIAIAIPLVVGVVAALLTRGNMDIYEEIVKPPLAPPGILFPIVWTILYVLMGISSALIVINKENSIDAATRGLTNYGMSLLFNFFWPIFFFNLESYLISFIWLVVLFYLILRTVLEYRHVSRLAALLQIPYLVWVAFAGYLNCAIWLLNP